MTTQDWHDSYFRKVMQYPEARRQFLQWLAPTSITDSIDMENIKLLNTTYIDKQLRKSFSDVVFDCQFKDKAKYLNNARIIILIEHQSKPERFLPVRVHHYMLSLLNKLLKDHQHKKDHQPLPAIYPMVYYNGKTKTYPYSTKLRDCVTGPFKARKHFTDTDIQVININQLTIKQTSKHNLVGIMTEAMKRTNKKETEQNYQTVLNGIAKAEKHHQLPHGFTASTIQYMMNVKHIDNFEQIVEQNQQLSLHTKGEVMTTADVFEKRGAERVKNEIVINMLQEGVAITDIAKFTKLDIAFIEKLSQQQQDNTKH